MGLLRDRPALPGAADTLDIRLPGGKTLAMPRAHHTTAEAAACCFCGEPTVEAGGDAVTLEVGWNDGDSTRNVALQAHRDCLRERVHEQAKSSLEPNAG